ncbi:UNKNOWN [Stylonychia lemnae]|uniref:Uncharacterized protein n=1 Tax=Stylonychia lemnae TaxID=5949 RepID=A0A078B7P5_STYLE|nr:UNKNOWN [Stylonychia lemnae]|eukprot:CDW89578.1 UNKNOWN [Stylonychia lemnae]
MKSVNLSSIIALIIVSANLLDSIKCSVAQGFVSTNYTAGVKCVACVSARQYYCTNPTTKALDCYDNSDLDCPAVNASDPNSVTWPISPMNCTQRSLGPAPCNSTIKITSGLVGRSESFSVQLNRNQFCGFYLINDMPQGKASWSLSESGTAFVQYAPADSAPDFGIPSTYDFRTYSAIPVEKQALDAGSGVIFIAGNTVWNTKVQDPANYIQTFEITYGAGMALKTSLIITGLLISLNFLMG